MALGYRPILLAIVTVATISVSLLVPAQAQRICYRPDGSMYAGSQPPPDCSPDRPKSRDEAIRRDAAISRPDGTSAPVAVQDELNRRLRKSERTRVDPAKAELVLKECDAYKYRPAAMNEEQAAVCHRYWQDKATKTLRNADSE